MCDDLAVVPGLAEEPAFAEPWQAQAFAMAVALHERGAFTWDVWAATLGPALEAEPDYWTAWLRALETVMAERSLATAGEIEARTEAWREAADRTPHGQPIVLR